QLRLLPRVGVRAVDDDVLRQVGLFQRLFGQLDRHRIVVRPATAAAQYDVAVTVAARSHDAGHTFAVYAEEAVRVRSRQDGVGGHRKIAVGGVLEADRGGQAGRHLAVGLRLRGARADGGPGNQVAVVLRRDRVQCLGGGGQADFVH